MGTAFKVGDKIRVSMEGVVEDINHYGEPKVGGFYHYVNGANEDDLGRGYDVEVIERAKPKVGDVIPAHSIPDGKDDFPDGTIVRHSGKGDGYLVRVGGKWGYVHEPMQMQLPYSLRDPNWDALTIVFIPEG